LSKEPYATEPFFLRVCATWSNHCCITSNEFEKIKRDC